MIPKAQAISLFDNVNTSTLGGVGTLIGNALIIASIAAGAVSVIFIIVGAIQYITSAGGEGIKKAKTTIAMAIAGLVISIVAYGVVTFLIQNLTK